jgi:hypothetical protein
LDTAKHGVRERLADLFHEWWVRKRDWCLVHFRSDRPTAMPMSTMPTAPCRASSSEPAAINKKMAMPVMTTFTLLGKS